MKVVYERLPLVGKSDISIQAECRVGASRRAFLGAYRRVQSTSKNGGKGPRMWSYCGTCMERNPVANLAASDLFTLGILSESCLSLQGLNWTFLRSKEPGMLENRMEGRIGLVSWQWSFDPRALQPCLDHWITTHTKLKSLRPYHPL